MATGIKDPYEDIKRPICGEFVEIGQPTFAELIWAREVLTRATSGSNPNVKDALRIVAYGKSPIELPLMRQQGTVIATPPPGSASASAYAIGKNQGKAYKQKVKGLSIAKSSVDFHTMIVNDDLAAIAEAAPEAVSEIIISPQVVLGQGNLQEHWTLQDNSDGLVGTANSTILTPIQFLPFNGTPTAGPGFEFNQPGLIGNSIRFRSAYFADIGGPDGAAAPENLMGHLEGPSTGHVIDLEDQHTVLVWAKVDDSVRRFNPNLPPILDANESVIAVFLSVGHNELQLEIALQLQWVPGTDTFVRALVTVQGSGFSGTASIAGTQFLNDEEYEAGFATPYDPTNWNLYGITTSTDGSGNRVMRIIVNNVTGNSTFGYPLVLNINSSGTPAKLLVGGQFIRSAGFVPRAAMQGWLDEPAFWGRTATVADVEDYYNQGAGTDLTEDDIPPGPCDNLTNHIFNSKFETSIAGWDDLTTIGGRIVEHDDPTQTIKISGIASQTISDLSSGDTAVFSFDVHTDSTPGVGSEGKLDYQLRRSTGPILSSGSIETSDLQPVGQANKQSFGLTTIVPDDGIIEVFFSGEDGTDQPFLIDNCVLCTRNEDDCGPGTRNQIENPNFVLGVENWNDAGNNPLTPTDPIVWDSGLSAIIVTPTGEPEVQALITEITPGKNYSLNFELVSFEPSVVPDLELIYGVKTLAGDIIAEGSVTRGNLTIPERINLNFTADSSMSDHYVFFKGGDTSGEAKIRNVLVCDSIGICEDGFIKISSDDFEENRGAWSGGTHDLEQRLIILGPDGGDNRLSQTYFGLIPGSELQLTFNTIDPGILRIEMRSDEILSTFDTNGQPGVKTFSAVIQDSGMMTILISNLSAADIRIDDVLVCQSNVSACDGSITDLEVLVEWDGIPRKPANLFNTIVRYTIRDPDDPFIISTVTHITTDEGVLGLPSCDTWKQQGQGGIPQTGILSSSLTPNLADSIAPGDFASVAARTNWIWSIPDTGGIQDMLSIEFQTPPPGLIESVEVILLANYVLDDGSGTEVGVSDVVPIQLGSPFATGSPTIDINGGRNEWQLYNLGTPTGGTFTLTWKNETTDPIPWDASNYDIAIEFLKLPSVGQGVDLIGTIRVYANGPENFPQPENPDFDLRTGGIFLLTYFQPADTPGFSNTDHPLMEINGNNLIGSNLQSETTVVNGGPSDGSPPQTGRDSIHRILIQANSGTHKITFGLINPADNPTLEKVAFAFPVQTTGDIPFDATAAELQTILEALPSIGSGNIQVYGGEIARRDGIREFVYFCVFVNDFGEIAVNAQPGNRWTFDSDDSNLIGISGSDPVTPPPLLCSPDPASELKISIRFKNSQNLQREFTKIINKNNIWQQNEDFTSDTWDTVSPVGHGLKGSSARWENFLFVLDDVDGGGLDQCTTPFFSRSVGIGTLSFPTLELNSQTIFVDECLAEILITPLSPGLAIDEAQSIILPAPSGGLWTLTFDFGTVETTTSIPWNASATQIRNRLAALPNIGSNDNVIVTGSGTQIDPFIVIFTGTLGARDHNLMVANGDGLTGASSAFVSTINDGTINERQTISRNSNTVIADLLITFGGSTTTPLAFDRSLNEAQSALSGLSSIGVGNVLVTGDIVDRDIAYTGPLKVDFIGTLSGQNVGMMTVVPSASYTVILNWMGGVAPAGGADESQLVTVEANGGTFVLRIFDIGGSSPAINVDTPTQGGTTETDCYDITFGGTLATTNIDPNTFFGPLVGPTTAFSHTQQNIRQGGTESEIQRHCFQWLLGPGGIGSDNSPFGLTAPSDAIFADILGTVGASNLVKGVDGSSIIKTYLESAVAVPTSDLTIVSQQLAGAINEVQTVTLTGSPAGGIFALIVEGERTVDLPFNITAIQMQNALNGLPNLSSVTVTQSGSLPNDVIYTITFAGVDGGRNWQTIIADARDLEGGSLFADTAGIAFDASDVGLKTAIVAAASWLTASDIDVSKDAEDNIWTVTWTGTFARLDIPQMQADPSGSQLTGALIPVNEDIKGAGSNERQRLQIIRATAGSFTLAITLDGRTETTTAIPWNTTAAGLEAQILQLTFFTTPGQISVVDEYPSSLPPDPINSSYIVVFQRIFGDVPLMVADFQTTLLCNPLVLPFVDPGPYNYPLPDCGDDDDISCQSGPLLCKPGDGDAPLPDPDCCNNETITQTANRSRRLQIERDLFDPNRMINGQRMTLRDITLIKGLRPDEYTPYERNFRSGVLIETSYDREIETKVSFVLVENDLNTRNGRKRVLGHLSQHREILPARFTWPDTSFTTT